MQILKVIGLLMEYPDEPVVGMQGGRAGVDPPRRTDAYGFYPQPA